MKLNKLITPIIATTTLAATCSIPMVSTSCSCGSVSQMNVEDLQKSKEITCDSDKEDLHYSFVQKDGEHYDETYATIIDLNVHGKTEEPIMGLLFTTHREDRTIEVDFHTQFFISHYLAKYYHSNNYEAVPTTFKFKLINKKDNQEYTSDEYKLTVNPAEYVVISSSYSDKLELPELSTQLVLQEYKANYKIEDGYRIIDRSIIRYDGVELYGQSGVEFKDGNIVIPSSYVTGPIYITADAEEADCNVTAWAVTEHVTVSDFPTTVKYKTAISGKYTIDDGYELDEETSGVYVDGQWLEDGYTISGGNVTIDKEKVTGDVAICISAKDVPVTKYSVVATGDTGVNSVKCDQTVIQKGKEVDITGTYTIKDGYEFDSDKTYVTINGQKLEHGYTIKDGKILVNKSVINGNVAIFIGTTKAKEKVNVFATGDYYVQFGTVPQAVVGQDYKLAYKQTYGTINPNAVTVKAGNEVLEKDKNFTVQNGVITIFKDYVKLNNDITITASGTPTDFSFTHDFDDRIYVVKNSKVNYMVDFTCTIGLYMEAGTVTNWGCAVNGDETYTQYLQYDYDTKTFTLPGKYVKGNVKLWASLA